MEKTEYTVIIFWRSNAARVVQATSREEAIEIAEQQIIEDNVIRKSYLEFLKGMPGQHEYDVIVYPHKKETAA